MKAICQKCSSEKIYAVNGDISRCITQSKQLETVRRENLFPFVETEVVYEVECDDCGYNFNLEGKVVYE